MESRCALKARVRLVGYVGGEVGSDLSLKVIFQLAGDRGLCSRDARMESRRKTTHG